MIMIMVMIIITITLLCWGWDSGSYTDQATALSPDPGEDYLKWNNQNNPKENPQ